jgi:hypothetical protein
LGIRAIVSPPAASEGKEISKQKMIAQRLSNFQKEIYSKNATKTPRQQVSQKYRI